MSHPMRRREFLVKSSRAALGFSLFPFMARSEGNRKPAEGKNGAPWKTLIADLEKQIPILMEAARVPGLSIAIIKEGKLFWRRGFGVKNISTKEPVDNDTVFEAASTTKPLFAYTVLKLCERGVMDLDTPLIHYTDGWQEPAFAPFLKGDPRLDLITARRVLSHTSGLPNWRSKEEPLAIAFTPGEKWSYSGEGYCFLQSVVLHRMGAKANPNDCGRFENDVPFCATVPSLDDYMKEHLLVPFRMASSGFFWTAKMMPHLATGHDPDGKPFKDYKTSRRPSGPMVARYGGAGGLYTTPTDYAKFLIEILHPKPADQFRLTGASLKEMIQPQVKRNAESSWALGWEINHTKYGDFIRHGGGNPGFSCLMAWSPERKSGYVIMTNAEDIGYFGVIEKLITGDTLAQFLGGKLRGAPE